LMRSESNKNYDDDFLCDISQHKDLHSGWLLSAMAHLVFLLSSASETVQLAESIQ